MSRRPVVALAAVAMLAMPAIADAATAHQIVSNNGVTVTMHVSPDDEPIAAERADILVPKVKTRTGKFSWSTCKCELVIADSSGKSILDQQVTPHTVFTFPSSGAYSLTFSGRVLRGGAWAPFSVAFAIRAD